MINTGVVRGTAIPNYSITIRSYSMNIYYLYIKTHNKTGLKYLGQTKSKNPHKYKGSGKYWKLHLKKHGNDFTTTILLETTDKNKVREMGIYYSNEWDIVASNEWANLKIECGDGGGPGWKRGNENHTKTPEFRKWRSTSQRGANNPKFDHTKYTFQHKLTGEICQLTQSQFIKMTGAFHSNVSDLVNPNGKLKSLKKWIVVR